MHFLLVSIEAPAHNVSHACMPHPFLLQPAWQIDPLLRAADADSLFACHPAMQTARALQRCRRAPRWTWT